MNLSRSSVTIILGVGLIATAGALFWMRSAPHTGNHSASAVHSPYAGQEARGIKALSQQDIEGLLAGAGTPLGGMAKPAELNGFPGPRHVLDAVEAGEFELTDDQQGQVDALYEEMRTEAVALGEKIVELEEAIDTAFVNGTIAEESLREMVTESAELYGQLRTVHLKTHLSMVDILTPE